MVQQLIDHAKTLSVSNITLTGFNSTAMRYIWQVGLQDMLGGFEHMALEHGAGIVNVFNQLRTVHIVVFVISWLGMGAYIVFMLLPSLRRGQKETKRVAELLSQLPAEAKVEKLVAAVVGGGSKKKNGGGGSNSSDTVPPLGQGEEQQPADDPSSPAKLTVVDAREHSVTLACARV
jgi:hypothetical protein